MSGKEEKIFNIALAVFSLESSKGHLSWKVIDLEKKAKVSRSLIYRYLGSNKKEILEGALSSFIENFYGLTLIDNNNDFNFSVSIKNARQLMISHYESIIFYQKWRLNNTELSKKFIKAEQKFQKKLIKLFPQVDDKNVIIFHSLIHGLVTAPFISPEEALYGISKVLDSNLMER